MKTQVKFWWVLLGAWALVSCLWAVPQTPEWVFFDPVNSSLPDTRVLTFEATDDGRIWAGTRGGGLADYTPAGWEVFDTVNSGIGAPGVTALATQGTDEVWCGHQHPDKGLSHWDGIAWDVFAAATSGLPENEINALLFQEDTLWIGTQNAGLVRFDGQNFTVFDSSNSGMPGNEVAALGLDQSDRLWIGTRGAGLIRYDGSWTVFNQLNSGLPSDTISAIVPDRTNRLYLGTPQGLSIFDGTNWDLFSTSNSAIQDNQLLCLAFDADTLYLGTRDSGLVAFNGDTFVSWHTANSPLPHNQVIALFIDEHGNKWMGLGDGQNSGFGAVVFRKNGVKEVLVGREEPILACPLEVLYPQAGGSIGFRFQVLQGGTHRLEILDLNGRRIKTVFDGYFLTGQWTRKWQCDGVPPGLYLYRYEGGGEIRSGKVWIR